MRVFIIEDNPADVTLFREALKVSGIEAEVTHFSDGVTAVAGLNAQEGPWTPPPDIVFLDLNMPRLSGFEVLDTLRKTPRFAEVRVAVFTSSHSPADVEMARRLRADRFVRKPSQLREFFDVVKTTINDLAREGTSRSE